MASILDSKINSYRIERGIEFSQAYTLTPTQTGLNSPVTFTAVGFQIAYEAAPVGPPNGSGSWRFGGTEVASSSSRLTANVMPNANDRDYSMGFWFRLANVSSNMNSFPIFTHGNAAAGANGFAIVVNTVTNGSTFRVSIRTNNIITDIATNLLVNDWQYISVRRDQNNIFAYHNGNLGASVTNSATTNISTTAFGSQTASPAGFDYNISNFYYTDWSSITPEIMQEIYQTGVGTNNNFNALPASASALLTEESVSTTSSVDFSHSSIITTALLTVPTIVIVNYDNVQVTTNIPVDALMVNPFSVIAQVNISNNANPMTADAQLDEHIWFAGSGTVIPPLPLTADALAVMPPSYGSGSLNFNQVSLTASATIVDPAVSFKPNYRHLVKRNTPSLYINSPDQGIASYLVEIKNDGYNNWGIGEGNHPDIKAVVAPGKMLGVGNGNAIRGASASTQVRKYEFTNTNAANSAKWLNTVNNNFSFEFWIYTEQNAIGGLREWIVPPPGEGGISAPPYWDESYQVWFDFGPTELQFGAASEEVRDENNVLIGYTYNSATMRWTMGGDVSYNHIFDTAPSGPTNIDLFTPNAWNHVVINGVYGSYGGTNNLQTSIWINSQLKSTQVGRFAKTTPTGAGFTGSVIDSRSQRPWTTEIAVYQQALSNAEIATHYEFIDSLSPNRNIAVAPLVATVITPNATFLTTANKNFPANPITASAEIANPVVTPEVWSIWESNVLEASAEIIEKTFAGDPDALIEPDQLLANAELGTNIFRLDTAYYSYVKTNIAPHRYVTFDQPNIYVDQGSDNKYALAAPFVVSGTITSPAFGLANNSLLSDGIHYTTSGLIMKESEWDDDWGTESGSYHSSFWIKRSLEDTASNGLRIIESAYSEFNDAFGVLYQYQNQLHFQIFNGEDYFTASSTIGVNVFDYSKHHIVVNFRITGTNHFVDIYVDKQLVITANVGAETLAFVNSDTFLPPNTEDNNKPRMSVGALIVPIELTALPVVPTPSKMFIDEVHWAQTSITQAQVISLYEAMPFTVDIDWNSDVFLSLEASMLNPSIGAGFGVNAEPLTANAETIIEPSLDLEFGVDLFADILTAEANAIEVESVVADNITNIAIVSDTLVASAEMTPAIVAITLRGPTLFASARLVEPTNDFYDEFALLILSEGRNLIYSGLQGYGPAGYAVGDVD
jgi:hypothetical protein